MDGGLPREQTSIFLVDNFINAYRKAEQKLFSLSYPYTREQITRLGRELVEYPLFTTGPTHQQQRNTTLLCNIVEELADRVDTLTEVYSSVDSDAELFTQCFQFKPQGKVEVVRNPFCVYIRVYDKKDYASLQLVQDHTLPQELDDDFLQKKYEEYIGSQGLAFPSLRNDHYLAFVRHGYFVAVEEASLPFEDKDSVYRHEVQHVLFYLFNQCNQRNRTYQQFQWIARFESIIEYLDVEPFVIENYSRSLKYTYLGFYQSEILAYYVGAIGFENVEDILSVSQANGGGYDYFGMYVDSDKFKQLDDKYFKRNNVRLRDKLSAQFDPDKMREQVRENIRLFRTFSQLLESRGCSKQEVAAIASFFHISSWSKLFPVLLKGA